MILISKVLIAIVAIEHFYIFYMEMFAWETLGKKTFKGALPDELFKPTKSLAANQGLYNFFLAAGLAWSLFIEDKNWSFNVAAFFLGCVIIAGCYGAYSAHKKIFYIQALPAIVAMLVLILL